MTSPATLQAPLAEAYTVNLTNTTPNCSIYLEDRGNSSSQIMCMLIYCVTTYSWTDTAMIGKSVCVLTFTRFTAQIPCYKETSLSCDVISVIAVRPFPPTSSHIHQTIFTIAGIVLPASAYC